MFAAVASVARRATIRSTAISAATTPSVFATAGGAASMAMAVDRTKDIVVMGGSGFVGRNICREAVLRGHRVTSVNPRGRPTNFSFADENLWACNVKWVKASAFEEAKWASEVKEGSVVISSMGKLGSSAVMSRIIGDANVSACEGAAKQGASKFVLISAAPINNPASVWLSEYIPFLNAYVKAKTAAEQSVIKHFGVGEALALQPTEDDLVEYQGWFPEMVEGWWVFWSRLQFSPIPLVESPYEYHRGQGSIWHLLPEPRLPREFPPSNYAMIRPGYIYGPGKIGRSMNSLLVHFRKCVVWFGGPMFFGVYSALGAIVLERPSSVEAVAKAAVVCAEGQEIPEVGIGAPAGAIKTTVIHQLGTLMS